MLKKIAITLVTGIIAVHSTSFAATEAKRPENPSQAKPVKTKPEINLPERANGDKALKMLEDSGKIKDFAAFYGLTVSEVQKLFKKDKLAFVDKTGSLHYVEPTGEISGDFQSGPNNGTSFPLDQTFMLESKPGALRTIYLDFDGHVTTNTAWNSSYGISTINSPAFDLDSNPGTFNSTELLRIQNIWKRVAEDYAPFDVNVTTRLIDEAQLNRASSSDNQFGVRVVITRDFTDTTASPCGCGGFAYVGVFDYTGDTYKPAFVFYNRLGSSEKNIAEATSHEAGHTLGLRHDGTATAGYYQGHGTGVTGWAPIMGVGYSKPLVQWSKGEYAGANNQEDDYLVMQNNSLFLNEDDYGNTLSDASVIATESINGFNVGKLQGVLQGPNDVDTFAFDAGAGVATIDVQAMTSYANSDLAIQLMDSTGSVLAQANPAEELSASISANLPATGRYFLQVDGTGKGDPLGTGYSDYGSAGIYSVSVSTQLASVGPVAPIASASASITSGEAGLTVNFDGSNSYDLNNNISSWSWNFGDGATGSGVAVSHTFQQSGVYNVVLTVTDSTGLSSTDSVTITVNDPVTLPEITVGSIQMNGKVTTGKGKSGTQYQAESLVNAVDESGACVPNAIVTITWGGIVSGSQQATTSCGTTTTGGGGGGKGGKASRISGTGALFLSPKSNQPGTITIQVNNIDLNGSKYVEGTKTQESINVF